MISLHRDFREETSLKSRFALRILYILLRSLRLGQSSSSATTLEECTKAAQTFQAIVTKEVLRHDDKAGLLMYVVVIALLYCSSSFSFLLAVVLIFLTYLFCSLVALSSLAHCLQSLIQSRPHISWQVARIGCVALARSRRQVYLLPTRIDG